MTEKYQLPAFTSPVGEAVYPWITAPDTKHVKTGVYHCGIAIPKDDLNGQAFIAQMEAIRDEFLASLPAAKRASAIVKNIAEVQFTYPPKGASEIEIRDFVPVETGNIIIRFKLNKLVEKKAGSTTAGSTYEQSPIVVDAETGGVITSPIYAGSIIRIRGNVACYYTALTKQVGVSLRMKAVQVIDLVTGGGGSGTKFWTDFDHAA